MAAGEFRAVEYTLPRFWFVCLAMCFVLVGLSGAQQDKRKTPPVPGPMLQGGTMAFETPKFNLLLVRSSQTLAALKPRSDPDFDFTPGDLLIERSQNGYFHLGDITLRLRAGNSGPWRNYSTATNRVPVTPLPGRGWKSSCAILGFTRSSIIASPIGYGNAVGCSPAGSLRISAVC